MVILILNLKKVKISSRIDWRHTHTQFCESPISRQAVSCRQMQGILVENQEGNHVKNTFDLKSLNLAAKPYHVAKCKAFM